jgi:glycosyltransferase involved in cell wall biosynthesis
VRVLVTTPPMCRPGGVSQYLRVLKPHLHEDVDYFTVGSRSDREGMWTGLLRMARDSWRFAVTAAGGRYDIVHLNPSIGPKALIRDGLLLLIAKVLRKRVVVFAHGWDQRCLRTLSAHFSRPFRWVFGQADCFIVLGNCFKGELRALGYHRSVFVEGAPLEDGLLSESERQPDRAWNRSASDKFTILFLARMEKEKGIYEALEAYRLVNLKHPFVSLVVAGDGSELNAAVRYAFTREFPAVQFAGHLGDTDKWEAFRGANLYLFPSYNEGLPLSVLEAMAFGLPVVTSAAGGLSEFFQHGEMGFMTESLDPEILASLINQLIIDPALCARMSVFNRNYASRNFRGPQVAARLEGIYRFVLEGAH